METSAHSRRRFLARTALAATGLAAAASGCASNDGMTLAGKIMTVTGAVSPTELGVTLPHEHVIVDFIGAAQVSRGRYVAEDAFATALPFLRRFRELGGRTMVDCTPAYIGRDARLLRFLSEAAGVQIVSNTGYYGAVGNKFLPPHAHTESAGQLADRWVAEWRHGIEDTGVRPGFIKLGVESGALPPLHEKLLRAGSLAHLRTGLPIAVHTGDGAAALDQLRVLREMRVDPSAWIWVHAQNDPGPAQLEIARAGGWISLDGISQRNGDQYLRAVQTLKQNDLLGRVLLSSDDGWSIEGQPRGENLKLFDNGNAVPYVAVLTQFVPLLRANNFSTAEVRQLLVVNPARAFRLRKAVLAG